MKQSILLSLFITPLLITNSMADIKTLEKFNTISLAKGVHLFVQCNKGDLPSYDMESITRDVIIINKNGTLSIIGQGQNWIWGRTDITINIPQKINNIRAYNGSRIESNGCILNENLNVELHEGSKAILCGAKDIQGILTAGSKLHVSPTTKTKMTTVAGAKVQRTQC